MRKILVVLILALALVNSSFAVTFKLANKETNTIIKTEERPLASEWYPIFAAVLMGDPANLYPNIRRVFQPYTNKMGFICSGSTLSEKHEGVFYLNKEETDKVLDEVKKICNWY